MSSLIEEANTTIPTYVEIGVGRFLPGLEIDYLYREPCRYIGFDTLGVERPSEPIEGYWYDKVGKYMVGSNLYNVRSIVDLVRYHREYDANRSQVDFVYADARQLPLKDDQADEVIFGNVLGDPNLDTLRVQSYDFSVKVAMMREAVRILKTSGFITVIDSLTPHVTGRFLNSADFKSLGLKVSYVRGDRADILPNDIPGILEVDSKESWHNYYRFNTHGKYSWERFDLRGTDLHLVIEP